MKVTIKFLQILFLINLNYPLKANEKNISGFVNFGLSYVELDKLESIPPNSLLNEDRTVFLQGSQKDGVEILRFTQLGLNLYYPINPSLDFRGQVVAEGSGSWEAYFNLDWGYLVARLNESSTLKLGRQLFPFWKDSQYQDVEISTTLRDNPDIKTFNPFKYVDGLSVQYETELGEEAYWILSTGIGMAALNVSENDPNRDLFISNNEIVSLFTSSLIEWNELSWHAHLSYNFLNTESEVTGKRDQQILAASSAIEWDSDLLFFEIEGAYSKSMENSSKRTQWAESALEGLQNNLNNPEKLAKLLVEAQHAYAAHNGITMQVLLGKRLYEKSLPYIGYSFQKANDVHLKSKFGEVDLTPYGIEFTSSLYFYDVSSFLLGYNFNIYDNWIIKFNYSYKNFKNPQFKDGKANPDFAKNGALARFWNYIPKDKNIHSFKINVGTIF